MNVASLSLSLFSAASIEPLFLMLMQGGVGSNAISPVTSAAQLRTMRKGSTDHLVLSIDSESSSLINNVETDEDKGL